MMAKTMTSTRKPDSLVLENIGVMPNETNQEAYERIRKLFCAYIDVKGSAKLAEVVQGLAESEHGDVIVSAYMSACVRLNCTLRGVASELQIMMLPMMVRSSEFSSLPSEIDQITAAEVQRIIAQKLAGSPFAEALFIPSNRLLSCNEFEGEQPQTLQEILQGAAQAIHRTKKSLRHNYVSIPKNEQIGDVDDNLMFDGKTFITCRLMPFVVVQRLDGPKINSFDYPDALQKIARAIEMSCEGYIEGEATLSDAQVIAPCVYTYAISNPFIAEALIQSKIGMEKLYFDVGQFIEDVKSDKVMASIMFAPLVGVVTIDLTKTGGEGQTVEAEFSIMLKHNHSSYIYIETLARNLRSMGVGLVHIEILDNMQNVSISSATLH
jgi:hypothetical protein